MNRIHDLEQIENTHTEGLEERGFQVYRGWSDELAGELVELSRQPHILEDTPGDADRRFRDQTAAKLWHDQGRRSVYTLRGDSAAGLIWYDVRPRVDVEADYTFAVRMYEEARGKKLAHGFMMAAHVDFAERKGNPSVWLDVAKGNPAARHLYDKFGYQPTHDEDDRTVMVYRPER